MRTAIIPDILDQQNSNTCVARKLNRTLCCTHNNLSTETHNKQEIILHTRTQQIMFEIITRSMTRMYTRVCVCATMTSRDNLSPAPCN